MLGGCDLELLRILVTLNEYEVKSTRNVVILPRFCKWIKALIQTVLSISSYNMTAPFACILKYLLHIQLCSAQNHNGQLVLMAMN